MSHQTRAALDDAIRAHMADETPDAPVAHWSLVVGLYDDNDRGGQPVWLEAPDGQPGYVTAGLLHYALNPTDYDDDEEGQP